MPWKFDENMDSRTVVKFRLRKLVPVSSKDDPICLNTVYLSISKPTVFGRILTDEVKVRLVSKSTPLMISRKHATVAFDNGVWTITDHKSVNGVAINGQRIPAEQKYPINIGDRITFGCSVRNNAPEFEYCFEAVSASRTRRSSGSAQHDQVVSPNKKFRISIESQPVLCTSAILQKSSAQIGEQERKIRRLSDELKAKETYQNELLQKLETTEQGLLEKLEQQREDLQNERIEAENKLKQLLEEQLHEKESLLKREYDGQLNMLQAERERVEKNLQEELSKKLSEKDQSYQLELEKQKNVLDKALLDKESEKSRLIAELQVKEGLLEQYKSVEENQKQLEDCLMELRKQIEEKDSQLTKQQEETKQVEQNVKQTMISAMEDEFTCIICQELFVHATILPCAHTFCELCILGWMKKKKNCPVCRRKIKGKAVRSFAFDSAVEKVVSSMDEEMKERRRVLKQEREEEMRIEIAAGNQDKDLIHKPGEDDHEDDDNDTVQEPRPGPSRQHAPYRRQRSRSRSPRGYRPYHTNRNYGHSSNYSSSSNYSGSGNYGNSAYGSNSAADDNAYYQHQPRHHYHQSHHQGHHQSNLSVVNYMQPAQNQRYQNFFQQPDDQYHGNYQRQYQCYICGCTSHFARNCPRR